MTRVNALALAVTASSLFSLTTAPYARSDVVAYLVNMTVRPGYNFASADTAIVYGHEVCQKVSSGMHYSTLINDIKRDFNSFEEYQAAYLVNQAVNELCPIEIWQLRNAVAADGQSAR